MPFLLGNRLQGTYVFTNEAATPASVTVVFAITGFSHSGGDRPEIDVTTGADKRRKVLPGLASPEEMTLSVKYEIEDAETPSVDNVVQLREALEICDHGVLTMKMYSSEACGTDRTYLAAMDVDAVSWNFSTELDGIMEGEVTFRVRH